jgi:cobalt transporter subunit CbtA
LALLGSSLLLNLPITRANGPLWGLCGFLAFALAPSAGLPPELPGLPVAELWTRQLWWWFTVAMTASGLAMVAKHRSAGYLALAIVLIGLPHLIGAPNPPTHETNLPAHLASGFVANALATASVFWIVLGLALGFINERTSRQVLQ